MILPRRRGGEQQCGACHGRASGARERAADNDNDNDNNVATEWGVIIDYRLEIELDMLETARKRSGVGTRKKQKN